jgi:1-acyl-sn-glycerol-3-phosphate acyltransferase
MTSSRLNEDKNLNFIFALLRFFIFLNLVLIFIIHHSLALFLKREKISRLNYFIQSVSSYSRFILKLLSVKIDCNHQISDLKASLIVSNHQSYLDILILSAHYPTLFITSVEIQETPVLGLLCELAGCSFVERRKSLLSESRKADEVAELKDRIQSGANVTFFPEATSTNGQTVLPFKSTFFQSAIETQCSVVPVVLKYFGKARDTVPWYGKMTFLDHFFRLCQLNEISVSLKELNPVIAHDKFELAKISHQKILMSYQLDHSSK